MKKCKPKKMANGGVLDSVLPMLPAALGIINPALGAASGVALNMYNNSKQQIPQAAAVANTNPYGFALGGQLVGSESVMEYKGAKHSAPSGGIAVNELGYPVEQSNQMVEGEETRVLINGKPYIFSSKLKYK